MTRNLLSLNAAYSFLFMRSKADFPKSEDSASWMRNLKLPNQSLKGRKHNVMIWCYVREGYSCLENGYDDLYLYHDVTSYNIAGKVFER